MWIEWDQEAEEMKKTKKNRGDLDVGQGEVLTVYRPRVRSRSRNAKSSSEVRQWRIPPSILPTVT